MLNRALVDKYFFNSILQLKLRKKLFFNFEYENTFGKWHA